jgi:hypothetical protein
MNRQRTRLKARLAGDKTGKLDHTSRDCNAYSRRLRFLVLGNLGFGRTERLRFLGSFGSIARGIGIFGERCFWKIFWKMWRTMGEQESR